MLLMGEAPVPRLRGESRQQTPSSSVFGRASNLVALALRLRRAFLGDPISAQIFDRTPVNHQPEQNPDRDAGYGVAGVRAARWDPSVECEARQFSPRTHRRWAAASARRSCRFGRAT